MPDVRFENDSGTSFELTIASFTWLTYLVNIKFSVLSVEKTYTSPQKCDHFLNSKFKIQNFPGVNYPLMRGENLVRGELDFVGESNQIVNK